MPGTLILPDLITPRSPRAVDSYGPRVVHWTGKKLGIDLDAWQRFALERVLEHDDNGNLIAEQALISVARQNGKTVLMRALTGWMLGEGYDLLAFKDYNLILFVAHDAGQANIPYDQVRRDLIHWADVGIKAQGSSSLRGTRASMFTGSEHNGIRVQTATSQPGSGRGVSPGLILFDEVLTQTSFAQYEVLAPSQVAIRNALMLMTSTAGFADSVVLRQFYNDLYRQATEAERPDERFCGMWWRASDDDVGLDWDELQRANPALADGRLRRSSIEREYAIMPKGSWTRERLNRWADERVDAPFSLKAWGACRVREPLNPESMEDEVRYVVAVDVTADFGEGTIAIAGMRKDGRVGVEVHRHLEGRKDIPLAADDFVREVAKLCARVTVSNIVYTASSALAPAFARHSVETQLPYEAVSSIKALLACADFAEAVTSKRLAHDDPYLDAQIAGAQRRFIGAEGSWRWVIGGSTSGIPQSTGVIAATYAVSWAARNAGTAQVFI